MYDWAILKKGEKKKNLSWQKNIRINGIEISVVVLQAAENRLSSSQPLLP